MHICPKMSLSVISGVVLGLHTDTHTQKGATLNDISGIILKISSAVKCDGSLFWSFHLISYCWTCPNRTFKCPLCLAIPLSKANCQLLKLHQIIHLHSVLEMINSLSLQRNGETFCVCSLFMLYVGSHFLSQCYCRHPNCFHLCIMVFPSV